MSFLRKYEIRILLREEFSENELKTWVFNYVKILKNFCLSDISVTSHGKYHLAYPISKQIKGNYIQLNFSTIPKYIHNFSNILKIDTNVLRFLTFNKVR